MIRLGKFPRAPFDLDLVYGIKVTVRPINTALIEAARAGAARRLKALREDLDGIREAGGQVSGLSDLDNPDTRAGLEQQFFFEALAFAGLVSWEGVLDEGGEQAAAITEETVADFMAIPAVAQSFIVQYTKPYDEMIVEGNGLPAALSGTSAKGEAGSGVQNAGNSIPPAVAAN